MRFVQLLYLISVFWTSGVLASLVNVALHKPTRQKDTHYGAVSSRAVDGNRNMDYWAGSCSHTVTYQKTWWAVDMLTSYPVHKVTITNRFYDPDLRDFFIYVSNENPVTNPRLDQLDELPGELCLAYDGTFPNQSPQTVYCDNEITGRYLYFWKPANSNKLCLCEVEIFVEDSYINKPKEIVSGSFSVLNGWRSQISSFSSRVIPEFSLLQCVSFCLTADGGVATMIQINKISLVCECIQKSSFDDTNPANVQDSDWSLVESTAN